MIGNLAKSSLELRNSVAIALEGAVNDIGAGVVHVRHDRLVHGAVPRHVAWASVSVAVHVLVVLMEHWVLAGLPLAVSIRHRRVSWQHTSQIPIEQLGVVRQSLSVHGVVVQKDRPVVAKTTADTPHDEEHDPDVGKTATNVEAADRELTDGEETKSATKLSAGSVIGVIEIRAIDGASDLLHLAAGEP